MFEQGGASTPDPFGNFGSGAFGGAFGGSTSAGDANETGDVAARFDFGNNDFTVNAGGSGPSMGLVVAAVALGLVFMFTR